MFGFNYPGCAQSVLCANEIDDKESRRRRHRSRNLYRLLLSITTSVAATLLFSLTSLSIDCRAGDKEIVDGH